jgi:hypothetical protein
MDSLTECQYQIAYRLWGYSTDSFAPDRPLFGPSLTSLSRKLGENGMLLPVATHWLLLL